MHYTNKNKIEARIKITLRKLFLMSEFRSNIIKRCRVSRGIYHCEKCLREVPVKELNVHHKNPIGKADNWDEFISRLFCDESLLIGLCKSCHLEEHKHVIIDVKPDPEAYDSFFEDNN